MSRWLPALPIAIACAVLAALWDRVPDKWVVHWGRGGVPNGWVAKSIPAALAPMLTAVILWGVCELILVLMRRMLAKLPKPPRSEVVDIQDTLARSAILSLSVLCSGLALALPLLQPKSSGPVVLATFLVLGVGVAIATVRAHFQTRRLAAMGILPKEQAGLLYKDPNDKRLMVPKTIGLGTTFNFAHPAAWPLFLLLLCGPLFIVLWVALAMR